MKLGILTYHTPCNFGANLQAFASVSFFSSLGYDVKIINYIRPGDEIASYCNRVQVQGHWNFSQKKLPVTRPVSADEIISVIEKENIDVIILGADAVWNKNDLDVYGLAWLWKSKLAQVVKVVCLSPAFMGRTYLDLPIEKREEFKKSLLKMSYVNTRDEWTKYIINKEIMGFDFISRINPDPVFLLDEFCKEKWENSNTFIQKKKYYVVSFPKNFNKKQRWIKKIWLNIFMRIVHKKGYKVVELPIPEGVSGFSFDYSVPYPIDPLQWFLWLKNAKGFIGLRFHAIVSCISAGTPFFSLDVYGRQPLLIMCLNALGIHIFDRRTNINSKIRNLLEGSGFEKYRINGSKIHMISPFKVFGMLENQNLDELHSFKEKNVLKFYANMNEMLSIVEGKND